MNDRSELDRLAAEADYYEEAARRQTPEQTIAVLRSDINTLRDRIATLENRITALEEEIQSRNERADSGFTHSMTTREYTAWLSTQRQNPVPNWEPETHEPEYEALNTEEKYQNLQVSESSGTSGF